jgi:prolyl oligopeptidase
LLDDTLEVKFSGIAWKGNEGFYYSRYDKPKEGSQLSGMTDQHKLFYHKLGTKQTDDMLIFGGEKTPRRYVGAYVTEDQNFLVISAANATFGNELYFMDLTRKDAPIVPIVTGLKQNNRLFTAIKANYIFLQT